MNNQVRTNEQFLNDLRRPELEFSKLKKYENNHKIIAEALKQERELYDDLANALPCGIYRLRVFHDRSLIQENWSNSNDTPYDIEFVNDCFCEILNLDRVVFEKNPGIINDLVFEADKAEFARKNVEANLHMKPFIWEGRFIVKDNPIWIHFESIPRLLKNGDIIWTGTLNNISKRKNTELEIATKNHELHILNAEKDKFLSIIAHDLRSPFNAIIGLSRILIDRVKEKDLVQIDEFANFILQSSNRAMDLLKDLLEWAQSQTGRMKFNPVQFEMVDIVNELSLLYDDIAGQKSITIKKVLPHNITVFADKAMIGTVLRNLFSNAIKFTKPGGEVIISIEAKHNDIIFSIKDTGVGILKDSIAKLFRIDKTYSTSGTNEETGTGLGLILCKDFVEKHNGKIWVESEVGNGSTFYFTLPFNPKQKETIVI